MAHIPVYSLYHEYIMTPSCNVSLPEAVLFAAWQALLV